MKEYSDPWNQALELKFWELSADKTKLAIYILNCQDRCGLALACHSTPNQWPKLREAEEKSPGIRGEEKVYTLCIENSKNGVTAEKEVQRTMMKDNVAEMNKGYDLN